MIDRTPNLFEQRPLASLCDVKAGGVAATLPGRQGAGGKPGSCGNGASGQGLHPHSKAANATVDRTGREEAILDVLRFHGKCTDRAIAEILGRSDLNYVRPRVTELIAAGAVVEVGSVKCPTTGRRVRQVYLAVGT